MDTSRILGRRRAIQILSGAALGGFLFARPGHDAFAARGWCQADPLLRIGGQRAHVYITSQRSMLRSATDKILLNVTLPRGVEGKLIDILSDFGEGYDVEFHSSWDLQAEDGMVPVRLAIYCPTRDSSLSVSVEFAPVGDGPLSAGSAAGTANDWISLTTS
jgi:hypothetical protein